MKNLIRFLIIAIFFASSPVAKADLFGSLKGLIGNEEQSDDISNFVGGLIGGKITYEDLVGTWEYEAPAVSFESENLLMEAGGAAAATTVESKIEPYYTTIGLNNLKVTFESDSTFTMELKRIKLAGKITSEEEDKYTFNFQALGKIKIGTMTANVDKSANDIKLTFDVSKLIGLLEKISSISRNSTLQSLSSLLSSYDGLNAGFKLKKEL